MRRLQISGVSLIFEDDIEIYRSFVSDSEATFYSVYLLDENRAEWLRDFDTKQEAFLYANHFDRDVQVEDRTFK